MPTIAELKSRLDAALETDWTEPATDLAVDELGRLLGLPLSKSFCEFLTTCGAGGVVPMTDISGILDGEPASRNRGSVLGDTLRCRDEFDLPAPYVVVFFDEDVETMWCLETSKMKNGECPVVSWEPFEKQTYPMFPTFAAFFEHYVTSHLESHALDHSLCRAKGIWEHTHAHGPIARLWRKIGLMNAVHGIWICRYAEGDWNTAHFAGEPVQNLALRQRRPEERQLSSAFGSEELSIEDARVAILHRRNGPADDLHGMARRPRGGRFDPPSERDRFVDRREACVDFLSRASWKFVIGAVAFQTRDGSVRIGSAAG